jgi:hypothetical protein
MIDIRFDVPLDAPLDALVGICLGIGRSVSRRAIETPRAPAVQRPARGGEVMAACVPQCR